MNQNTRQRIIGTIVLAIVAIILLPAIFDGESSYQSSLQTNIPDRPERPVASRELPQRPTIQADSDAIQVREPVTEDIAPSAQTAAVTGQTDDETPVPTASSNDPAPQQTAAADTESEADNSESNDTASESSTAPSNTVAEADSTTSASNNEPGLDVSGLPEAWSVRVGAFGNATNASNLTQRLTEGGHRAYTRPVNSSGRELTAVFVGPLISRQEAQNVLTQVKSDYDLNGMIVRYEIEGP